MTFRIIALDPGGETGWATFTANDRAAASVNIPPRGFASGTLGPRKHHDLLTHLLENQHVDDYVVVCERFLRRPGNDGALDISLEYQGVVERFCEARKVPLHLQTSSQAKAFVTDKALRRLSLYVPTRVERHARDATRHLLWYMINKLNHNQLLPIGWKD
jgi:hypothetical protein